MILGVTGSNDFASTVIKQRKSTVVIFRLASHTESTSLDVVEYDTDKFTKGGWIQRFDLLHGTF